MFFSLELDYGRRASLGRRDHLPRSRLVGRGLATVLGAMILGGLGRTGDVFGQSCWLRWIGRTSRCDMAAPEIAYT